MARRVLRLRIKKPSRGFIRRGKGKQSGGRIYTNYSRRYYSQRYITSRGT